MKEQIKQLIENKTSDNPMLETGIKGVQLFKVTQAIPCAPAVYEPAVIAILNGSKEAILDGDHFVYGTDKYLCCPMSMPVEAGTPRASEENPLLGVYISLDNHVMRELAMEMDTAMGSLKKTKVESDNQSLTLASWDNDFTDALLRLLQLLEQPKDINILSNGRLRELYYAILKGEAGLVMRRAFGVGNDIARAITFLSSHLEETITIDDMASQVGMSRAALHRKFKDATRMSPIQFIKSMRLNKAAMNIAAGMNVSEASMQVGYVSSSQFSREFKRMYGQSPKQWSQGKEVHGGLV